MGFFWFCFLFVVVVVNFFKVYSVTKGSVLTALQPHVNWEATKWSTGQSTVIRLRFIA